MKILIYKSQKRFIEESVRFVLSAANSSKGIVRIALSGGSTPQPIYTELSKKRIDFEKVHFYVLDERYVPIDNPDSNSGMIIRTLFASGPLPNTFVYFDTSKDIHECIDDFSSRMPNEDFDLMILGVGSDGHIASLFPNAQELYRSGHIAHTQTDQFAVKDRLTMTFSPIKNAKNILLLLKGVAKKGIIDVLEGRKMPDHEFPVKHLKNHPRMVVHYLEKGPFMDGH